MTLRRRTPLQRTGRLNPIGKKRRRDQAELDKARPFVVARGCEYPLIDPCAGPMVVHHWRRRSQGGSNDLTNLVCLCDKHHKWVHDNPRAAQDLGLLARHRWEFRPGQFLESDE